MHLNIKALIEACDGMEVGYQAIVESGNMLILDLPNNPTFVNCKTPLNSESMSFLCQDKTYFYQRANELIAMPETTSYLNPDTDNEFKHYCEFTSLDSIINDIENQHQYPLIVKPNRGAQGINVYKVMSRKALKDSLEAIFSLHSQHYDYRAIAQMWVDIHKEYRAIFLDGELELLYEKSIEGAKFVGNLSPHHWEGSRPLNVDDTKVHNQVRKFIKPLFKQFPIRYVGFDIVIDTKNNWWLLEANTGPAIKIYIDFYGQNEVVNLYRKMIESIIENPIF